MDIMILNHTPKRPTIQVQTRSNYGTTAIYPVCDDAKTFAAMLGQKTLTHANIKHILHLNYEVVDVPVAATTFKL